MVRRGIDPDREILPLIGSKEGVMHVSMTFLNPGDAVLLPNPGYPTYRAVCKLLQAEMLEYELDEQNDWQPDFEALEKMDLSRVKLMWVNYPHMPTGAPAQKALSKNWSILAAVTVLLFATTIPTVLF